MGSWIDRVINGTVIVRVSIYLLI